MNHELKMEILPWVAGAVIFFGYISCDRLNDTSEVPNVETSVSSEQVNYAQFGGMITLDAYETSRDKERQELTTEVREYWRGVMAERVVTAAEVWDYMTEEWGLVTGMGVAKTLNVGEGVAELRDQEGNYFYGLEGQMYQGLMTDEEYSVLEKQKMEEDRLELREILTTALIERPYSLNELVSIIPQEFKLVWANIGMDGVLIDATDIITRVDPSGNIYYGLN